MSTISTKFVPRPSGEPPMTITRGKTLVDDMEIIRKLCLPPRTTVQANESHLTFGRRDPAPIQSTQRADFANPNVPPGDLRAEREARSREMWGKHFVLSCCDPPAPQTENRAEYVPHGLPRQKKIHRIGGPHDKNASDIFFGQPHLWAADLETTNQADFIPPTGVKRPPVTNIGRDHRANHFQFGDDEPELESLARGCYKAPPPGYERAAPLKEYGPSIELGSKDYPWAKELKTTTATDFCQPVVIEEDALTKFVRRKPLTLGDDKREMLTEHRGAYKKPEFMDCTNLTDAQLTMLGVTREQILPVKLPLHLMSEGFRNSLGQSFGAVL